MHQAELHLRLREHGFDGLRKSFQPVNADDEHVGDAAIFQLRQHLQPELRPFRLAAQSPSTSLLPSMLTPMAT